MEKKWSIKLGGFPKIFRPLAMSNRHPQEATASRRIFSSALSILCNVPWMKLDGSQRRSHQKPKNLWTSSILSFWIAWKILESYLERPVHLNMPYIQDTKHQFVGSDPMADWKVVHGNARMKGVKVACLSLCMVKDQVHLTMSLCLCECVLRAHHLALWASL